MTEWQEWKDDFKKIPLSCKIYFTLYIVVEIYGGIKESKSIEIFGCVFMILFFYEIIKYMVRSND